MFWSDNGDLCCIATDESFYILRYDQNKVDEAKDNPELVDEDGISNAFDDVSIFISYKNIQNKIGIKIKVVIFFSFEIL